MRTRKQIEVAMERAGSAMAHELRGVGPTSALVMAWDTAFGDMQQINHLTGTPSYEALEAERNQLAERVAVLEAALDNADLENIEKYRVQMAAISCAAFGYCPPETPIQPAYVTLALRDVQALYIKYAALAKATPHPHADEAAKVEHDIRTIDAVQHHLIGVVRAFGDISCAEYISTWHKPELILTAISPPSPAEGKL